MQADGQLHAEYSQCAAAGRYVAGSHVDHLVPVTGADDPTFFDPAAVGTLCPSCHSRKTQREQREKR